MSSGTAATRARDSRPDPPGVPGFATVSDGRPAGHTAGSLSASLAIHLLAVAAVTYSGMPQLVSAVAVRAVPVEILRVPRPKVAPAEKPPSPSRHTAPLLPAAAHAPADEAPSGPPPPFRFEPDVDEPQQLPLVLARWKGCLAFGQADEPRTLRARLCGPGFERKEVYSEPVPVGDKGYDVDLREADRWSFVRQARARCAECEGLVNVWALFPWEFGDRLEARLRRESAEPNPGAPSALFVRFHNEDAAGIAIRKGQSK